jgi:ergothioneine biosynthesis protein EgtB
LTGAVLQPPGHLSRADLSGRLRAVRAETMRRTAGLSAEDQCVQSMPEASPAKWHLAHTSWFFETVVLAPHEPGYEPFDARWLPLFNSYYESLGPRHPRPHRGLLTRPSLQEIHAYRAHVDTALARFIAAADDDTWAGAAPLLELGLHHEQQHQELIVTDILHAFWCNPLLPAYDAVPPSAVASTPLRWLQRDEQVALVGHAGTAFAFDNERPRHRVLVPAHRVADRLVTCGEYLDFMEDGGYRTASLWLSEGWAGVQANGWTAPLYWLAPGDPRATSAEWQVFGPGGVRPLDRAAPVSQLSFYEAAAYADWAGARLPTEFEWEAAHADPASRQLTGHVWQWTRSSYDPYPGFRPLAGAVGEYNGKFMVGQIVLRGGSLATPAGHARPTYRNFFPPAARWQFSGLRLAKDGTC